MKKIEVHKHWWLGENHQWHKDQEVLIRLSFPRVMIRYNVAEAYFTDYEKWKDEVADIQWIDGDKLTYQQQEEIIIEGWNFLAIEERLLEQDMEDIEIDEWLENEL